MKKPHEQEWRDVGGPCGGRIVNAEEEVLADEVSEEALPLMLAAPDMARALLAFVDAADNGLPTDLPRLDHGAREALRKAGVL
jgi:hypothetical protein